MELELDAKLADHGRSMESRFTWLFPELGPGDDAAIRRAVAYRQKNPYRAPDLSRPESWKPGMDMHDKFVLDTIEGQKTQRLYRQKVLDAYGTGSRDK
ncbi:MAG: hypothetical protein JWN73_1666 [Betaproteobacteria bacterium]|nr:hypothetical protein [Betaproteobacteria bacterium]